MNERLKKNLIIILFLLIAILLFSKELKIKVIDTEIDIPLEGCKITINEFNGSYFTNENGEFKMIIDDNIESLIITGSLLGYDSKKIVIKEFDKEIIIKMSLSETVYGEELVIEEDYYSKQAKIGTSTLIDKEEIKLQATRGNVEDVITALKTMPGVSYSANFMTDLSIRGGDPSEFVSSWDGFLIRNPFYWGSAVSLFNPNIVESAVFNNGIFSVKDGMAMSGFLKVNSQIPNEGFKIMTKLATSTFELYSHIPVGLKNAGILFGGRVTYLDLTMGIVMQSMGAIVTKTPYIYDSFFRWYWKPNSRVEWFVNGYFGADGVGTGSNEVNDEGMTEKGISWYDRIHSIGATGVKIFPTDKMLINFLAGYEFRREVEDSEQVEKGTKKYSDEFKNKYGISEDSFDVNLKETEEETDYLHSVQSKFDFEYQFHEKILFSLGGNFIYDYKDAFEENKEFDYKLGKNIEETNYFDKEKRFNSGGYLNLNIYPVLDTFEIELGVRVDHFIGLAANNSFNTYPVINPRLYLAYTPVKNLKWLESFTISLGVGLYSKIPDYQYNEENYISNFEISQNWILNNIIGLEFVFPYGFKLKLEGYYKYYLSRHYVNTEVKDDKLVYYNYSDGKGQIAGFDLIFKRKISRYIDGWISYSFIYIRLYNPQSNGEDFTLNMEPVQTWFYPSYHRWHSLNLVLNVNPTPWFTLSPSFGVFSGIPKLLFDDKKMYAAYDGDQLMEFYSRDEIYSDTERTKPSFLVNFKVDFHFYFPKTKVRFEAYIALDNITSIFYKPDLRSKVNKYTGDIYEGESDFDFFLPSFGIKISY